MARHTFAPRITCAAGAAGSCAVSGASQTGRHRLRAPASLRTLYHVAFAPNDLWPDGAAARNSRSWSNSTNTGWIRHERIVRRKRSVARRARGPARRQGPRERRRDRGPRRADRPRLARAGCAHGRQGVDRPRVSRTASARRDGCGGSAWHSDAWPPAAWRVGKRAGVHHLVVCTLCSCYPRAVLGYPPFWFKSVGFRARAVRDPHGVLANGGPSCRRRRGSSWSTRRPIIGGWFCRCAPPAPTGGRRIVSQV